jgi:hypothetical protein
MTVNKFNAEQARNLSKENNSKYAVDTILEKVRQKAKLGEFSVRIYEYGFGSDVSYYNNPYSKYPQKGKEIIEQLRSRGFKADVQFDMNQLVDQYLLVSWDE